MIQERIIKVREDPGRTHLERISSECTCANLKHSFFFKIQMLCIMFDKLDVLLWCTVCSRSDFANQRRVLSAHGHVCVLVIQR